MAVHSRQMLTCLALFTLLSISAGSVLQYPSLLAEASGGRQFSPPSRAIGKVIDLNKTTPHAHNELEVSFIRSTGKTMDMVRTVDVDGDGARDIVFRYFNGTPSSPENRTYLCLVRGPLTQNATYDPWTLTRWTIPFKIKSFLVCDHNGDGASDLLIAKKQYRSVDLVDNSSFLIYDGSKGAPGPFPWQVLTAAVWFDPKENRTAENLSFMDVSGDGANDILFMTKTWFKYRPQDTYAYPTSRVLVMDGLRSFSGYLTSKDLDTELSGTMQLTGRRNSIFLNHPMQSGDIDGDGQRELISLEIYHTPSMTYSSYGAVLVFEPLDLGKRRVNASGNQTHTILGTSFNGSVYRTNEGMMVGDLGGDGFDDIFVFLRPNNVNLPNQFILMMNGSSSMPVLWDLAKTQPSVKIEGFIGLLTDYDRSGKLDLFVGYPRETISDRNNCGVIRAKLDPDRLSGVIPTDQVNDISILGEFGADEIGRTQTAEDMDADGMAEVLVWTSDTSARLKIYMLDELTIRSPSIVSLQGFSAETNRGSQVTAEITARDDQNYPRYLELELELSTGSLWMAPDIISIIQNFSYNDPYGGSTFLKFSIPMDLGTGPMDVRVSATNTFGLSSGWVVFGGVTRIGNILPYFTKASLSPSEVFRGEALNVSGSVVDPDDQADLSGSLQIKKEEGWTNVSSLSFDEGGAFRSSYIVPKDASIGTHDVRLMVWDDNGGTAYRTGLTFETLPRLLVCDYEMSNKTVLRGDDLIVHYVLSSDLNNVTMDITLTNDTTALKRSFVVIPGEGNLSVDVPLDAVLGAYEGTYAAFDGRWSDSGDIIGTVEVMNNPPVLSLPAQVELEGLTGTLNLSAFAWDREDGADLSWSVSRGISEGIDGFFTSPGQLFIDMHDNRTRDLLISVEDGDGARTGASLSVGSQYEKPSALLRVRILGRGGLPLPSALVSVENATISKGPELTDNDGICSFVLADQGDYELFVLPPAGLEWVEGQRSGYVEKRMSITVDGFNVTREMRLDYRTFVPVVNGTLEIVVSDQDGLPVQGAEVTITGPVNDSSLADASGTVIFDEIKAGQYTVRAYYQGSDPQEKVVMVEAGKVARADIILELDKPKADDDDPTLFLLAGGALVGVLIGLMFLYLILRRGKGSDIEE